MASNQHWRRIPSRYQDQHPPSRPTYVVRHDAHARSKCSTSTAIIRRLTDRLNQGPPGMKLTALADVNGSDADEKMGIAKFLTVRPKLKTKSIISSTH